MFNVNKEKCIGCSQCVKDCPVSDISLVDNKAEINNERCFKCGHCIAICPVEAVSTDDYNMEEVIPYDKAKFTVDAENLLNFIKFRRSVRRFKNKEVEKEKIEKIVTEIYRGTKVNFEKKAKTQIAQIVKNGWDKLPICMAKTQYSFSDNPNALGAPENFEITIREVVPKFGAGFIVALTGDVMTMPGLPKRPAALNMDVAADGTAIGLF